MSKHKIIFFGDDEPILISKEEYENIKVKLSKNEKFIFRKNGDVIATSSIKRLAVINPEKPLSLPSPEDKPVTKDFLENFKKQMKERFGLLY